MKYFLHDTSAFDDEKITELFLKFGYGGLGLFYTTLEKIARQEKPIKTEVLKAQLKMKKYHEKCWSFMEELGLIVTKNGESFNEKLMNYSKVYEIRKESTKKRVAEWRERQKDTENVTRYERVSNARKVKETKGSVCYTRVTHDTFYESELNKTDDKNYKAFVDFLFGRNGTDPRCDYSLSLNDQIGYERYKKIKLVAETTGKGIFDTIRELENKRPPKYSSFYLTLNNWLKQKINVR